MATRLKPYSLDLVDLEIDHNVETLRRLVWSVPGVGIQGTLMSFTLLGGFDDASGGQEMYKD